VAAVQSQQPDVFSTFGQNRSSIGLRFMTLSYHKGHDMTNKESRTIHQSFGTVAAERRERRRDRGRMVVWTWGVLTGLAVAWVMFG